VDDQPEQVPAPDAEILRAPTESTTGELFLQGATTIASVLEPFARIQAEADVEKTKLQYEAQQHIIDVQADFAKHVSNERQTRFKWIAVIATLFGLLIFGLAITLVLLGDKTAGLLIITHAFAAVLGLFGGQGLARKSLPGTSETEAGS
jgi:hypothetical protein